MRLIYTRNRFELLTGTEVESALARKAGFELDTKRMCWWSRFAEQAKLFIQDADEECIARIARHTMAVVFSKADKLTGYNIPIPAGQTYIPFQEVGIIYAAQRSEVLIADEQGLGKTVQAIGIANLLPEIKTILVICPGMLKIKWARMLMFWLYRAMSIGIAEGDFFPQTQVVVINYDIVKALRPKIDLVHWDMLIVDEAHMIKDGATKRGKAIWGETYNRHVNQLPIQAKRTVFLTGTPLVNRPEELWEFVKRCDPKGLGASWQYFGTRYCGLWKAPWGWDSSGAKNLEELQNSLRASFMIRRKKIDVLKDLPPKRRQIVPIAASDAVKKLLRKELDLTERLGEDAIDRAITRAQNLIELAQAAGDEQSYRKAAKELLVPNASDVDAIAFQDISNIRKQVGIAKIPYLIEYIKLVLEEQNKIVVFAHHIEVLQGLAAAFNGKVPYELIYGDIDMNVRQKSLDRFQDTATPRIMLIGITLCMGFELTAASYGLMAELDWRPGVNMQAEDRMHRIGQLNSVLIQHLVFEGSYDAIQVQKVIKKQEVIEKAIG